MRLLVMENPDEIQRQLSNIGNFKEFLQFQLQNSSISNLIESITYNVQSQTVIIQIRDLLRRESDQIQRRHEPSDPDAEDELRKLSERYRECYPKFLECFKEWKPLRKELIKTSYASADKIDQNFSLVSTVRILTSTADIFGTTLHLFRPATSSLNQFAFENASYFGMLALFCEITLSKQYHSKAKKLIKEDQKVFEEMKKWFKQAEELDRAVKNFFPYGIDKDLVRRIDKTSSVTDQYNKLFMSIVASNVKNDVKLFTNRIFLDKAEKFASSEAGIQWFHKVILEDDPLLNECIKINLNTEISAIMTDTMQNPDILVGASTLLTSKAMFKLLLSGVTIFSAVSNLWNDTKSEGSDALRELATKAEKELIAIKKILELLKPSGVDIEDALQ